MIDRFRVQSLVIDAAKKLLTANLHAGDEGDAAGNASGRADPFAGAEVIDVAPVVSQMGVIVRPIVARTLRALGLRDGDDVLVLKLWDRAKTPTDVEEGETRVYACGDLTARVRLRQTGLSIEARGATITITSTGAIQVTPASGENIVLNGGNTPVAKEGSATTGHTHVAVFALTAPPGGGAVTGAITIQSATDTIATGAGSQRVRTS